MHNAESILIIILSTVLTIFLIVLIVLIVLATKLIKQLKRIADRAEKVVESASNVGELFKNTTGPLAVFKFVRNIVRQHGKKGK